MSGPKIVILVLVLILLVFAAALLFTDRSNGPRGRDNRAQAKEPAPGWVKWFGDLFSPEPPKARLPRSQFIFSQTQPPDPISIQPADDEFRTVTFVLKQGRVEIDYTDVTPGAGDLRDQEMELPRERRDSEDDPRRGTITVLKRGGTLRMSCLTGQCELMVE